MNWVESLFTRNQRDTTLTTIKDLFPYFEPDKFFIGWKRGTLDALNRRRIQSNQPFEFNGSASDFVILPKQHTKEETNEA